MKRLIAERSVLYLGRMYAPGDALPASDGIMKNRCITKPTANKVDRRGRRAAAERPGGRGENGRVPG